MRPAHVLRVRGVVDYPVRLLRNTVLRPRVAVAVGAPIDVRRLAGVDADVAPDGRSRAIDQRVRPSPSEG